VTLVAFDITKDTGWSGLHLHLTFFSTIYVHQCSFEAILQMNLLKNHKD